MEQSGVLSGRAGRRPELVQGPRVLWCLAFIAVAAFYTAFIARTPFNVNGTTYFSLFDDAMVSMRYARNLAEGHGLVWNLDGGHVEGYSNFLWTLWMALLHLPPLPDSTVPLLVMISGAVLLLATAVVAGKIVHWLAPESKWLPPVVIAATGLYYPLVFWTLRGMETGLVALLVSLSVLVALELSERYDARRAWVLGGLVFLGVLTRDDVAVPCGVILGFLLLTVPARDRRRIAAVIGGALAGALIIHAAARLIYYGAPLPNTYYLKLSEVPLGGRLSRGAIALGYSTISHLFAPLLLAGTLIVTGLRSLRPGWPLLAMVFLAQCAYSLYVGGDAWEGMQYANRYIAPVVPLLLVLAVLGFHAISHAAPAVRKRLLTVLAAGFASVAVLVAVVPLPVERLEVAPGARPWLTAALAACTAIFLAVLRLSLPGEGRNRRRAPTRAAVAAIGVAVLVLAAPNAEALRLWCSDNPAGWRLDALLTRYGVALRESTPPDTTVAVTASGALPYFSHRHSVDLLGKTDPVVARSPSRLPAFRPGHDKWSYEHSIGELRPDLVAQLWIRTQEDLCRLSRWGYERIGPDVYLHDAAEVERGKLVSAIDELGLSPVGESSADCRGTSAVVEANG